MGLHHTYLRYNINISSAGTGLDSCSHVCVPLSNLCIRYTSVFSLQPL